ncbi:MAG: hypothetical protein NWE87_02985 [Candidatus Bathyarchaeota archaeon]|nr:hypothetical protein [Candidatus Bathyarchaeota archaeon]
MKVKIPQYLVVCIPERTNVKNLVEYQTNRLAVQESPHLVWSEGYLYEYVEEWSNKEPYTHYIIVVNYASLKEYRRYAIMDQGDVSFSDTLKEARGSAIPMLIEQAEETHPRTQAILREIESKKNKRAENNY